MIIKKLQLNQHFIHCMNNFQKFSVVIAQELFNLSIG
jgi:hypothetical protein